MNEEKIKELDIKIHKLPMCEEKDDLIKQRGILKWIERVKKEKLYSGILAAVVLGVSNKNEDKRSIRNVSQKLFEIRKRGVDIPLISVEKVAGGYYSKSLDRFMSGLFLSGIAVTRDPIELNEDGKKYCERLVEEAKEIDKEKIELIIMSGE